MSAEQTNGHSLGKNAVCLILAKLSYIGASFVLYILLVQVFDRDAINTFGLAISFNSLFVIVADFGVTEVAIRFGASRSKEKLLPVFVSGLIVKLVYAVFWYLILYFAIGIVYDGTAKTAIQIACFSALIRSFSEYVEGIATGMNRSDLVAFFTFVQYSFLLLFAILAGVVFKLGVISVLWSYVFVMSVSLMMRLIWMMRCVWTNGNLIEISETVRIFFRESPKFGLALVTATINGAHLYVIVISLIGKTAGDLAIFQGGQKILGLLHILGGMMGRSFFAAASNAMANKNADRTRDLLKKTTHILAILSFGATIFFCVMGNDIADIIYLGNLQGAGQVLVLLSLSIPFALFQYVPCAILPAVGKQSAVTLIFLAIGVIGWPITYFATDGFGIHGTALAYVVVSFAQFVLLMVSQKAIVGYWPPFRGLWKIGVASLVMGIVLCVGKKICPPIIACAIGVSVYILFLALVGEIRISRESLRHLKFYRMLFKNRS